jgi:hypothetical protein
MRICCERCGRPFNVLFPEGYNPAQEELMCRRCLAIVRQEENEKKTNPNERLEAEVREAAKRGLTYGQFKGLGWYKGRK